MHAHRSPGPSRTIALFAVVSVILAACGGTTTSPVPGSAAPTSGASGGPAVSTDLSLAVPSDPSTFAGLPADEAGQWISRLINLTLYAPDDHLSMTPMAAADLPRTSKDGLTWTVSLRPGLRFSDGSPLTADDVAFSYGLMLAHRCGQDADACLAVASNVASVKATDPATVTFRLRQRFAPFLVSGLGTVPILPRAAVQASFDTFQQAVAHVDGTAVQREADKVGAALADASCTGLDTQPAACDQGTYIDEIEPILQGAGLRLPPRAAFTRDQSGLDREGYGQALIDELNRLDLALGSTGTDRVAASLELGPFASRPVGAGPYMFESYDPGHQVVLARNPAYFRLQVAPPRAIVRIIPDPAVAASALKQGDILFDPDVTADALPSLASDPTLRLSRFPDFGYYFIAFNVRPGHVYADPNLRRAFSTCIDHDATVAKATDGNGVPVYANVPPPSWAFNPDVPHYAFDPSGARSLIESSGWIPGADGIYAKGGVRLSTKLYVRSSRPSRLAFALLARDQLRQCGIELVVTEADFGAVLLPLLRYPNNFDTYLGSATTGLDPDDYATFDSSQVSSKDNLDGGDFTGWSNPQADALLQNGRTTLDQALRQQIYGQFQLLVHDQGPYYFLWSDVAHRGYSSRLSAQAPGTIDLSSPLDYWNIDAWQVAP